MLEWFYGDMERRALPFQDFAYRVRMEEQIKAMKKAEREGRDIKLILSERSVLCDAIFATNAIQDKVELQCYSKLHSLLAEVTDTLPDAIIYIRTDPEKCHERINTRGRNEEKTVPLEYLQSVHKLHDEWYYGDSPLCNRPVLLIDNNEDEALVDSGGVQRHYDESTMQTIAEFLQSFIPKPKDAIAPRLFLLRGTCYSMIQSYSEQEKAQTRVVKVLNVASFFPIIGMTCVWFLVNTWWPVLGSIVVTCIFSMIIMMETGVYNEARQNSKGAIAGWRDFQRELSTYLSRRSKDLQELEKLEKIPKTLYQLNAMPDAEHFREFSAAENKKWREQEIELYRSAGHDVSALS